MQFEIIDDLPEPDPGSRRADSRQVFEFAKENPGKWVKWPNEFKNNAGASSRASELRNHERYSYMSERCTIVSRGKNVYVRFEA